MDILQAVKEEVNKISPKTEVILFGSRARGDFRTDSDWDFLIIFKKKKVSKTEKKRVRNSLYELELKTDEVISALVHTEEEWEKRSVTPIYQIIKKEGKRA